MQSNTFAGSSSDNQSLISVVKEIATSAKDVFQSEIILVKEELKSAAKEAAKDSAQMMMALGLVILSALPFVAFLVLGLGEILDGQYWLSSLIVAVVIAAIGGVWASIKFKELKNEDLKLNHTGLKREVQSVKRSFQDLKNATQGRTV